MDSRVRELALFNLEIDSKRRGCDLVSLKVRDICHGEQVASRAVVMQHKTQHPVQFEITAATREAVQKWIKQAGPRSEDFVFPSRIHDSPHLGTRQYARILENWVEELGLDPADDGTHPMRRTKTTLIDPALPGRLGHRAHPGCGSNTAHSAGRGQHNLFTGWTSLAAAP